MSEPSTIFLVHGSDTPPAPPRQLRAGPLTLDYDNGDLRGVKFDEREIIRRIYGTVRDRNWGTISDVLSEEQFAISDSAFRIRYVSEHRQGEIHFVWHAELTGDADGTLRFTFDGEARKTFLRNRIGLCVLHPIRECAGARARARLTDEHLFCQRHGAAAGRIQRRRHDARVGNVVESFGAPAHWRDVVASLRSGVRGCNVARVSCLSWQPKATEQRDE